jgi:hypothetical protein
MNDLEQLSLLEVYLKHNGFWIRAKIPFEIWISKSWILRYIVLANANPLVYLVEQEVIQHGLQTLCVHLSDMHTLTLEDWRRYGISKRAKH